MHYTKPLISLITIITLVIILPACSKDDDKAKTKTELLTSGSWHLNAYTINPAFDVDGDGTDDTDVYAIMEPCIKDDHTTFSTDGSAILDEGGSKCDPSDPQENTFLWSFKQNETQIEIDGDLYSIESLTESQMVVKQVTIIQGVSYTHTVTFGH